MNKSLIISMAISTVLAFNMNGVFAECPISSANNACPSAASQSVCNEYQKTDCERKQPCDCQEKCKDDCNCKKPCDCPKTKCKDDCGSKKDCKCKDDCGCDKKIKKRKDKCCNPCDK